MRIGQWEKSRICWQMAVPLLAEQGVVKSRDEKFLCGTGKSFLCLLAFGIKDGKGEVITWL